MHPRRIVIVAAVVGVVAAVGVAGYDLTDAARSSATGASATPSVAQQHVVTIGDSIMAGYGLDDPDDAWPTLVARSKGFDVTNLACSGAGFIADGQCGTDFDGLVSKAVAAAPSLVVVQSSDNDLGQSTSDIRDATDATVEHLHRALPHAGIVGISTLWDQPGDVPDEVGASSAALQHAVQAVGGTFVDIGQPIAGRDGLLQSDDEHPTDAGQAALATAITADLEHAGIRL